MNAICVSAASASNSGVFAKSLAAKKTPEDHVMLHFRVSIWGQFRDSVIPPLTSGYILYTIHSLISDVDGSQSSTDFTHYSLLL